jgi:hypothetical protein
VSRNNNIMECVYRALPKIEANKTLHLNIKIAQLGPDGPLMANFLCWERFGRWFYAPIVSSARSPRSLHKVVYLFTVMTETSL